MAVKSLVRFGAVGTGPKEHVLVIGGQPESDDPVPLAAAEIHVIVSLMQEIALKKDATWMDFEFCQVCICL